MIRKCIYKIARNTDASFMLYQAFIIFIQAFNNNLISKYDSWFFWNKTLTPISNITEAIILYYPSQVFKDTLECWCWRIVYICRKRPPTQIIFLLCLSIIFFLFPHKTVDIKHKRIPILRKTRDKSSRDFTERLVSKRPESWIHFDF